MFTFLHQADWNQWGKIGEERRLFFVCSQRCFLLRNGCRDVNESSFANDEDVIGSVQTDEKKFKQMQLLEWERSLHSE